MAEYDDLEGIMALAKHRQDDDESAAGAGCESNRSGKRVARHVLVDGHGALLSLVVTGTNLHDVSQPETALDAPGSQKIAAIAEPLQASLCGCRLHCSPDSGSYYCARILRK